MNNIIDKIKKLLRLSSSANEHEAALAAARAQELILRHCVSQADLKEGDAAVEPIETAWMECEAAAQGFQRRRRVPKWKSTLAAVLAAEFLCQVFKAPEGILIVGRKTNRGALRATWYYLCQQLQKLAAAGWETAKMPSVLLIPFADLSGRRWKRGFYFGAVSTISERLGESTKRLEQGDIGVALAVRNETSALDEYVKETFGKTRKAPPNRFPATGYKEGRAAGHALDLSPRAPNNHQLPARRSA